MPNAATHPPPDDAVGTAPSRVRSIARRRLAAGWSLVRGDLQRAAMLAATTTVYYLYGRIMRVRPYGAADLLHDAAVTGCWDFALFALMLVGVSACHRRLPAGGWRRWAGLAALCLAAGGLGLVAMVRFSGLRMNGWQMPANYLGYMASTLVFWASLLVATREFAHRSRLAADALDAAELQQLALEGEVDQARAQMLQAQIEPHFLFNALANARRLLRTQPQAARSLLADLGRYLEEALPQLRQPVTTLAHEAELVRAFLAIHQVRMGPRLRAQIDIPAPLRDCTLPPMLLLTLTENALKHGLAPLPEGGRIDITASAVGHTLRLRVADTGAGMGSTSGQGMGLSNTRARLKAAYGAGASLALHVNEPRGVVAEIQLPQQRP